MTDHLAHYILRQPDIVEQCAAFGRRAFAQIGAIGDLRLVASGSSLNAFLSVAPALSKGITGRLFIHNPLDFIELVQAGDVPDCTVLVLSQSGASQTSVDAAEVAVRQGLRTFVLTANARAAIGGTGATILEMPIGIEHLGPKTMGYTGSLAALIALAERLGGTTILPGAAGLIVGSVLQDQIEAVDTLETQLAGADFILTAGRGEHLGTCTEAALKIAEITGIPAASFSIEELQHGRLHAMSADSACFLFAATDADLDLATATATALRDLGLKAWIVNLTVQATKYDAFAPFPDVPPAFASLIGILPFQLLARRMAKRRGIEPGQMRYPDMSQRLGIKTELRA